MLSDLLRVTGAGVGGEAISDLRLLGSSFLTLRNESPYVFLMASSDIQGVRYYWLRDKFPNILDYALRPFNYLFLSHRNKIPMSF